MTQHTRDDIDKLKDYAERLQKMMTEARTLGLHRTATSLHEGAVNVVGFELAELIEKIPFPPEQGERVVYDIGNPSDPYTMASDNWRAAAAACLLLGGGKYALSAVEPEDANSGCPLFLFGGGVGEWWSNQFGGTFEAWMESADNRRKLCEALDSVLIGDASDRREVEAELAKLPEREREAWLERRHDQRRSSMNNIGRRAKELAGGFREKLEDEGPSKRKKRKS